MPDGASLPATTTCCDTGETLIAPGVALARILRNVAPVAETESVKLAEARGRVLAAELVAQMPLPPFDQSAMDGYGLAAADLADGATPRLARTILAGDPPGPALQAGEAVRLMTGAVVPEGVAAVVMEEHVALRDGRLAMTRKVRSGDNLRRRGEDVMPGQVLLSPGTRVDARHIALAAAVGADRLTVRRRIRVAVLSNGSELCEPADARHPAGIHDSNRPMLLALLAGRPDIELTDLGLLRDDPAALAERLRGQAEAQDLILSSGGVRGSDADHMPLAVQEAGGTVEMLKLRQKPGKPIAHGRLGAAVCLCLPGNPLAALVAMLTLGRPLLARLAGCTEQPPAPQGAIAAEGFTRHPGREEFMSARIVGHDAAGLPLVARTGHPGSSRLVPLSLADGLLWVPAQAEKVAKGEAVRFWPFGTAFALQT